MADVRAVHPSHPSGRIVHASLLVSAVALLALVPACSSSSNPTAVAPTTVTSATSTTATVPTSATVPDQAAAQIAACTATAKVVDVALAAYQAEKGTYPSPVPWSAATYATNYAALTTSSGGGPFMSRAPATTAFVIQFDSIGHVWVSPPGFYGPYDRGQDIDASPDACDAAVG
jgi:hypothetical protein